MAQTFDDLIRPQPNPNTVGGSQPNPGLIPEQASAPAQVPQPQQIASPQQMAELKKLFGKVQNANAQLVSKSLIDRNQISNMRRELMMQLFELMQEVGVDPGDPQAVRDFMEQLSQQDPDLLEVFETAFLTLKSGPSANPASPEGIEQGLEEDDTVTDNAMLGGDQLGETNPMMQRFQNLNRIGQ